VYALDKAGNQSSKSVTFKVVATVQSLKASVNRLYSEGKITKKDVYQGLIDKLNAAQKALNAGSVKEAKNILNAFINLVKAQTGKGITKEAADLLIKDAQWVIKYPR
jgi:hypothetical protein